MNNEPVAWMYETELQDGTTVKRVTGAWELKYKYIVDGCDKGYPIPLYTHPVKEQLTDEEIMEIFKAYEQMQEYGYLGKKPFQVHLGWTLEDRNSCLMLARAILRKAQEK